MTGAPIPEADQPTRPAPKHTGGDPYVQSGAAQELFVFPARPGGAFQASIRGHMLELADPGSADRLAPTPDDLLVASIASDFAWLARSFLFARGLDDYVSVTAAWRTLDDQPRLAQLEITVTVSQDAATACSALVTALENRSVARLSNTPLQIRVRCS